MNGLNTRGQQPDLTRRPGRRLLRAARAWACQTKIGSRIDALMAVGPADPQVVDVCPTDFERRRGTVMHRRGAGTVRAQNVTCGRASEPAGRALISDMIRPATSKKARAGAESGA